MNSSNSCRGGWSLLELTICVAVIGLLASILLPLTYSVREKAVQVTCMNHLRQVGTAFDLYAMDFGGAFPHEDDGDTLPPFGSCWAKVLLPYLGNDTRLVRCPRSVSDPSACSYKMNSLLEQGEEHFFQKGRAALPADTVLLFDGRVDNPGLRRLPKGTWEAVAPRHQQQANFLFLDGHVASFLHGAGGARWPDPGPLRWIP